MSLLRKGIFKENWTLSYVEVSLLSGVASDDNPHDLEVENEKPDDLPGEELAPESGCACWSGREIDLFRAGGDVLFLHMF